MKTIQVGNRDEWRFEVHCHLCDTEHTIDEQDFFTVSIPFVPIAIPAFVCPKCNQTCIIRNGDMPTHVYLRLPSKTNN
jgi:uncharacterized protein YlaI